MTHSDLAALLGGAADAMDRDGAELARLQRMHEGEWRIWRTPLTHPSTTPCVPRKRGSGSESI